MTETAKPGAFLRAIRRERKMTLAEVAERTGIPVATLSKIELDQLSLRYEQIMRLSEELSVDVSEFFHKKTNAPANKINRRSINKEGTGEAIDTGNSIVSYLSTDLLEKQFSPILSEIRAKTMEEFGEFTRHPGEEFCVVIEGEMDFCTEIYAPVRLKAGESIYFDSAMGHAYLAKGDKPCRIISVCTAPRPRSLDEMPDESA